jgi:predicted RNase H-like nuclease
MSGVSADTWLAGLDGCAGGWVVAVADRNFTTIALRQIKSFAELFSDGEGPSVAAVDMPIGLPEQTGPKGRTPERLVRPLLGARQSSVFSIPSRAAVYAGADADELDERTRFLRACEIARATSAQGRAVAKQGFHIFPKIVDIDRSLPAATPGLAASGVRGASGGRFLANERLKAATGAEEDKGPAQSGRHRAARSTARRCRRAGDDHRDAFAEAGCTRRLDRRTRVTGGCAAVGSPRGHSFPSPPEADRLGIPIAIWA